MARSREQIISEMVDSGLFSDDEIKAAVSGAAESAAPSAAAKAVGGLSPIAPRGPVTSAAEAVKRFAGDTMEALIPPTSVQGARRMLSPLPGQFGPSRTLQEIGEATPNTQEAVGGVANRLSESRLGQLAPIPTALAGSIAYGASHFLPPRLTPVEAAASIGAEGVGLGVQALKPLVGKAGKVVAQAAEGASGLEYKTPGVLEAAAKDSSLMFGQGRKAAGNAYEKIALAESVRPSIARGSSPQSVIDEGLKALDDGTLTPQEALVVRQAVDKSKRTLPNYTFNNLRKAFDSVAKTVSANADQEYARAILADALRQPFPINKGGGTSIFKGSLGAVSGLLPLMSPALQGLTATAAGAAGRQVFGNVVPGLRVALSNASRNPNARKAVKESVNGR